MLALAALVGVAAGAGAIAFRQLVFTATHAFSGHTDPTVTAQRHWWLLVVPIAGGLIYGPLVARWAPEARGHGIPEVMLAVRRGGGRIRLRVPLVKALASAICIGSGGSVGREGPIAQIGAALGSGAGQVLRLSEARLRLIVACGAAGGIAATFNAPLGGAFFALEVVLGEFTAEAIGLVVVSAVVADALGHAAFGSAPFLRLPALGLDSPGQLPLYALLGLLAAPVAVGFTKLLYGTEDVADRWWRGPEALRPACGGILLGLLLLAVPKVYGVGYPVLTGAIRGQDAVLVLAGLLVAKAIATSLTMAIGGSGGVFAPSLFLGATLGAGLGQLLHGAAPGLVAHPGAFGLVGMAAVFGAAARAPIAAALVVFELTGDYSIMLPLLLAVVVAVAVAGRLSGDTIYTLKLRRRGIVVDEPPAPPSGSGGPGENGHPARIFTRPDVEHPVERRDAAALLVD
jgi:CIC family chloride channel protein